MSEQTSIRSDRFSGIAYRRYALTFLVAVIIALALPAGSAHAFWATLQASDNPNDGDFTLTWYNNSGDPYTLQEMPSGGTWSTVTTTSATSYPFTGHTAGVFSYRLKHVYLTCIGWPEPFCYDVTEYSETIVVTVNEPPPPPGGGAPGDPYPEPGPFTPPDDADFPDATISNPSVPTGDVGLNSVGALQGGGGVSGGQASYSIPIVIPPGRKGMQPSVSLNYSSSSGNGLVGVGWRLSAGSAITRCAATADPDGFTAAVQYDASRDRLCLDGMRLVVATGTYGQSGSTYRTELDSFTRITLYNGDINGSSSYFYVEHKDGRISRYGLTGLSRQKALGRNEVLTWAIYDQWDRSGNFMTYDYVNEGDGEYVLDAIHYTGRSGSQGTRHVRFVYEPNSEPRTFYLAGGKSRLSKRLKEIKTEYQSTLVRRYSLTYKTSDYSNRDLLTNVEECAYENGVTPHCLPTTDFEWQESGQQFETESRLYFWQSGTQVFVHGDKEELHRFLPRGDIDGDGVKDWDDHQVNAEGQITGSHTVSFANCFKPANSLRLTCLDADLNADGITDGIRRNGSTLEIALDVNNPNGPTWQSTGITWASSGFSAALSDTPLGFADFNGDGWVDLAMKTGGQLWIYFHTKNLAAPLSSASKHPTALYTYGTQGYSHTTDVQIYGDMDGNGTPDFVVSNIQGANDTPGLPTPSHIILTKSSAGGTLTTSTRNVPSYVSLQSAAIATNANFFHDINGDGLQDLVSVKENTVQLQYKENTGTAFGSTWKNLGFSIPYREVQFELTSGEPAVAAYPIMSKLLVMDYDGNGKDDMLVASNTVYASSCTKIAPSQGPSVWKCDDELYETYQAAPYAAVEAPINGSSLDNSVRPYSGYRFEEDAAGNIMSVPFSTPIVASASQTAVVDVNGDGLPDVVTAFGCRNDPACQFNGNTYQTGEPWQGQYTNSAYSATGAWINRNRGTSAQAVTGEFDYAGYDLLSAAEDGLGNRQEWTYKPLSSDAYDTTASDYYDVTHADEATNPDYFHFASSMNVVAEYRASNGIGTLNSTLYRYRGAIYNNKGRGFQGFQTIIVEEDIYDSSHPLANTDKISRTDFHQYWPVSSFIDQSCTWLVADNATNDNPNCSAVISRSVVDDIHDVATVGGARFVAVKEQTDTVYDLAYPARTLLTTKNVVRSFDAYGNITSESNSHVDDWTSNLTTTTAVYTATEATWWLNKLESRTVTTNPVSARHTSSPTVDPAQDGLKWVKTSYDVYDTTKRIPTEVTVTANDTALTSTVTTTLSSVGLPLTITTTGTDVAGPRTVTTTYSEDGTTQSAWGYFPLTITNALGHVQTVHTSPIHGQPTSQWDANNLLATTSYDAFGRVKDITPPGAPTGSSRYFHCGGAQTCPASARFVIKTYAAGAPESHAYVDQLGRTVQTAVRNFADTSFVRSDVTFDVRGNVTFESQPYDLGESSTIGTRYLGYDALGRLTGKEVDQTAGQILLTNYTHSGFTTNINAGGILMHRIYNGLGQLVETRDGEGGFTKYAYDGAGNPVILQDPLMVGTSIGIKAAFNALGQKEWVDDPDWVGQKTFTHNALGEVLSETDPNGNLIEMTYDALGRLIDRHVNSELNGKWHYDDTGTYGGLGLLWLEDSQFRADGSRHQKFYYYGSAATGRKDLLQVKHRFYENDDQFDYQEYDVAHFTDGYYARPKGLQYPGGAKLAFGFNSNGHLVEENDPESAIIYRQITAKNSRGQTTTANIGYHLGSFRYTQTNTFHPQTGQADTIQVSNGTATIQDLSHDYDVFGNLYTRSNGATTEVLYYDDVQRLVSATRSPGAAPDADPVAYTFDGAGNFLTKSDYLSAGTDVGASYFYESGRPHVLDHLTLDNAGTVQFTHDNNGNMTLRGSEVIAYNAFNKPVSITGGGNSSTFTYGASLMRYRQTTPAGGTVYYVDKLMEIETLNTTTDYRHYLGDIAVLTKTGDLNDPNPGIRYLFRDRLGSTATVGDTTGLEVESRAFDAFGKPRNGDWTDKSPPTINSAVTDRGFTDHEHLDDWQLIHMNGRGFDYNLGRFLSVDPVIQDPGNSQNLNPFTYILNNPLSGTDPSGYCRAETGTRIKDCVAVNVVDKDTGETATKELNRMHSGFIGQVAAFVADTLGNGALISRAIATFESGTVTDLMAQGSTTASAAPTSGPEGGGAGGSSTLPNSQTVGPSGRPPSYYDDLPLLPGEPGYVEYEPRQVSWLVRLDPLFCDCGYNVDFDSVLNSLPAFGPAGGMLGEAGAFTTSLRTAWAARGAAGTTVLGRYPIYIEHAQSIGARYFSLGKLGNILPRNVVWRLNTRFLDRAAGRGDRIVLARPFNATNDAGSWLADEIAYLTSRHGYTLLSDGVTLVLP